MAMGGLLHGESPVTFTSRAFWLAEAVHGTDPWPTNLVQQGGAWH